MDMRLEVVVLPVTDVDRAKDFYKELGWRLDADFTSGSDFRVVQLTPLGSPASVIFGTGDGPLGHRAHRGRRRRGRSWPLPTRRRPSGCRRPSAAATHPTTCQPATKISCRLSRRPHPGSHGYPHVIVVPLRYRGFMPVIESRLP